MLTSGVSIAMMCLCQLYVHPFKGYWDILLTNNNITLSLEKGQHLDDIKWICQVFVMLFPSGPKCENRTGLYCLTCLHVDKGHETQRQLCPVDLQWPMTLTSCCPERVNKLMKLFPSTSVSISAVPLLPSRCVTAACYQHKWQRRIFDTWLNICYLSWYWSTTITSPCWRVTVVLCHFTVKTFFFAPFPGKSSHFHFLQKRCYLEA